MNLRKYNFLLIITSVFFITAVSCISMGSPSSAPDSRNREQREHPEKADNGLQAVPENRVPVTSPLNRWADRDDNSELRGNEIRDLQKAIDRLIFEPHPVETPLDQFFDTNKNNDIDQQEIDFIRHGFLRSQVERLNEFAPRVYKAIDFNETGSIEDEEYELLIDYIFFIEELQNPHEAHTPIDEKIDGNNDGFVGPKEIKIFLERLKIAAFIVPPDEQQLAKEMEPGHEPEDGYDMERNQEMGPEDMPPVLNELDEITDINGDGFLSEEELMMRDEAFRGPHRVESEFDRRINFNDNDRIEPFEIERAQQAGVIEEGLEEGEEFEVRTPADRIIDLNKDGIVDTREIQTIIETVIQGPHETAEDNPIDNYFDRNKDGFVEDGEIWFIRDHLFIPHPVDNRLQLDKRLDENRDGFVSPEELGITAGMGAAEGNPSFEDLIEFYRWEQERQEPHIASRTEDAGQPREEKGTDEERETRPEKEQTEADAESSESKGAAKGTTARIGQKELSAVTGKKIAIMGITSKTEDVTKDTTGGILTFIENAFVNMNKVKVIDRQNIEKILEEQNLQMSGVMDQNTAAEIGKLSGADFIVMGTVSAVGKSYYLNIKLISVKTAEIVGSSISQTDSSDKFYDMCNAAVYKLF